MSRILFAMFAVAAHAAAGPLSPFFSPPVTITAAVVDSSNNVFITGQGGVPTTPGAIVPAALGCILGQACFQSFVAKISSSGTLVFSTYLSSTASGEQMTAIALDSAGNVVVAGLRAPGGGAPNLGIVHKLAADGSKLLGTYTFVGGTASAVAISTSGDVYLTGQTLNAVDCACTFATTPGALQTTSPGYIDAFVIRLDSSLSQPIYATLLGGSDFDAAWGIAVDSAGNALVTGGTNNAGSFPVTSGGFVQPGAAQGSDAFVVKLNASGSALIFSSLFDPASEGVAIAIDDSGIYVAGNTSSANLPASQNAFFQTGNGFVAKLTPDGSSLIHQTLVPGYFNNLAPFGIAVDPSGNLVLLGQASPQLPTTPDAFAPCAPSLGGPYVGPEFVMQFDPSGTVPTYSSYLPGGLAIRGDGQAWYADSTGAVNSFNINEPLPTSIRCVADALTGLSGPIAPGKLVKLFGLGIGPDVPATMQLDATGKVAVGLNGVNVYFNGIAAPLLSASANEIDAVVPFENMNFVQFPTSTVAILKNGVEIDGPAVPVVKATPVFYQDSQRCLTAFNADGTINSSAQPAALGSAIWIFGEGLGLMKTGVTGQIGTGLNQPLASAVINLEVPPTGFPPFPGGFPPPLGPAKVIYSSDVPGYVEGVFQFQVLLPSSFSKTGQLDLVIWFNDIVGEQQFCLWVKNAN